MNLDKVMKLTPETKIDYRDFNGRFLKAEIVQISIDKTKLYKKYGISYEGWADKWNVWSIPKHQHKRYSEYKSVSRRPLHRDCMRYISLKKPYGGYLSKPLRLLSSYLKWMHQIQTKIV